MLTTKKTYWRDAAAALHDTKMLVFAALIVALRVAVKLLKVPLGGDLHLAFDCYVNAAGSLVYGPLMGLLVGAVSDTLGCLLFPSGAYFFPFIFVEMSSSFLFALFFWRRDLTVFRILAAKFTVNFVSNILLTSAIMKWNYAFFDIEKSYAFVNLVRIVKNLVLFPFEAVLIALFLRALHPVFVSLKLLDAGDPPAFTKKSVWQVVLCAALSVGLLLFYIFFLKDYVSAHNFKWM